MRNQGQPQPFFPGEYKRWSFAEFHPNIEKLEMKVVHYQGSRYRVGQDKIEKDYTEKDMPEKLFCTACDNGYLDLSGYLQNLEFRKTTEDSVYLNCGGTIGRSPKGRNPGQQCSWSQFTINTKITYKD